ncbi:hypothetical protein RUM43_011337 [Polyplax serrata]|uniref:Uncharacterized protein n=1 Tax=Polyplax serrata TaxID=468196 RepID=A0AAN8S3M4_POLSC
MGSKENRGKPNEKIQLFTQAKALEDPQGSFKSPEFGGLSVREKFEKDTLQLTQSTCNAADSDNEFYPSHATSAVDGTDFCDVRKETSSEKSVRKANRIGVGWHGEQNDRSNLLSRVAKY